MYDPYTGTTNVDDRAIREHDRAGWVLGTWSIQLELGGRESGLRDEVQGLF
jgi:hypothetical protein